MVFVILHDNDNKISQETNLYTDVIFKIFNISDSFQ